MKTVKALCMVVALLAIVVLVGGWLLDIEVLRGFSPHWTPMAPLTALLLLLGSGGSYFFESRPRLANGLLIATLLIGTLVLVAYFTGLPLGLMRASIMLHRGVATPVPELPAPDASAAFILLAVSLFCFRSSNKHAHDFADVVAATIGIVCAQVVLAYVYNVAYVTGTRIGFRQIAPHSTLAVVLLAITITAHRPTHGIYAAMRNREQSGLLLRRLLPVTLFFCMLVGLLAMQAMRAHVGSFPDLAAWSVMIAMIGIALLMFVTSASMRESEERVRQREMELMTAHATAEAASNTKSRFMSVMSHELRTPLTGILGYADMLDAGVGGPLPPEARKFVDRIRSSGWHLVGLIDAVLTYASGRPAGEQIRNDEVDLPTLFRETLSTFEAHARDKQVELKIEVPSDPAIAWTDRARLRMVLSNVVSNAVKFTERGGVVLRALPSDQNIVVEVTDTGIGIDPKFLAHIWEPFEQEDDPHTREVGGMGLGMALTRVLCDQMSVPITVESQLGAGTTVRLVLPRAAATPEPVRLDALRLLVVDDETSMRRIMTRTLERFGAVVTEAENAQRALDLIQGNSYEVIVTDISMPGMNGIEMGKTLEKRSVKIPLVFVTGAELDREDRDAIKALGARCLQKPFDMAELARAVSSALQ
jgi:signal transduction histidine kinase/CheY-like chemotaxis protein